MTPQTPGYPVQPADINARQHFWEAFGHCETEISAGWIVRLCQRRGSWSSFSMKDLETFYNEFGHRGFWFNRLACREYLSFDHQHEGRVVDSTLITVTDAFVQRCFAASPVVRTCVCCGEIFRARVNHQKHCSDRCANRLRVRRQRERQKAKEALHAN